MELLAGVFIVVGILAVALRFTSQGSTGEVRLPRIVDESIGMWVLRGLRDRITGRGSASAEPAALTSVTPVAWSAGPASAGAAASDASLASSDRAPTFVSPDAPPPGATAASVAEPLDGAAASVAGAPLIPGARGGALLDPTGARFAATQQRLAAAGVRRVPRSPVAAVSAPMRGQAPMPTPAPTIPASTPAPSVIPPWSSPLPPRSPLSPDAEPVQSSTPAAPFFLLPAPAPARFVSPIPPDGVPGPGRVPPARSGWTARRDTDSAPAVASPGGHRAAVPARGHVAGVATTLTFAVVGLVAVASLQAPDPSQGGVLGTTGLPGVATPSLAVEPSGPEPSGASVAPTRPAASAPRSQAKPTPTARP